MINSLINKNNKNTEKIERQQQQLLQLQQPQQQQPLQQPLQQQPLQLQQPQPPALPGPDYTPYGRFIAFTSDQRLKKRNLTYDEGYNIALEYNMENEYEKVMIEKAKKYARKQKYYESNNKSTSSSSAHDYNVYDPDFIDNNEYKPKNVFSFTSSNLIGHQTS